ncbi:uncharacterized protein V6R79_025185 [Siganus canaliculatus]
MRRRLFFPLSRLIFREHSRVNPALRPERSLGPDEDDQGRHQSRDMKDAAPRPLAAHQRRSLSGDASQASNVVTHPVSVCVDSSQPRRPSIDAFTALRYTDNPEHGSPSAAGSQSTEMVTHMDTKKLFTKRQEAEDSPTAERSSTD